MSLEDSYIQHHSVYPFAMDNTTMSSLKYEPVVDRYIICACCVNDTFMSRNL